MDSSSLVKDGVTRPITPIGTLTVVARKMLIEPWRIIILLGE
jgi:hypothetical protein